VTAAEVEQASAPPQHPEGRSSFWPVLLGIVAVAVVIRVLYTLLEAPWPPAVLDDEVFFSVMAQALVDGHGYVNPFLLTFRGVSTPTAGHPPLYSFVLAGLAELGGKSADAQRLTGTVFGAGTIVVIALIGRRLAGARAGLLAAGLAAIYPMLIAADGALMSESLFGLLAALTLLAAYRLIEAPTLGRAALLGLAAGLAALARTEALLLLLLVLVPAVREPGGWRAALVAVLAAVVVVTPWSVRNWTVFDRPVLVSTTSDSAIAGANCAGTYHGHDLGFWQLQCIRPHKGNEVASIEAARSDGVRYARDHTGRLPVVLAARLARTWSLFRPFQTPEGRSQRAQKLGVIAFFLLVPFAVVGGVALRRRRVSLWVILMPVVVVTFIALVTYGNVRFRQSAELSLVVLAGAGLDWILRRWRPV
jgi:4-amino-4-deoxy-L-arabinose transferase-like glycosyltransferase